MTNNIKIKNGLLAGFVASAVSSIVLTLLTAIATIPEFNFIQIQGSIFGIGSTVAAAWATYFAVGLIWGLFYTLIERYLPTASGVIKGALYGILVYVLVMIVLMPLAGVGFFLQNFGFMAALIVLISDLLFGILLGYFYEKLNRRIILA